MLIKKGQIVYVKHNRKGDFDAVATEDFESEDRFYYPLVVAPNGCVEGKGKDWLEGESIPCKRDFCLLFPTDKYLP